MAGGLAPSTAIYTQYAGMPLQNNQIPIYHQHVILNNQQQQQQQHLQQQLITTSNAQQQQQQQQEVHTNLQQPPPINQQSPSSSTTTMTQQQQQQQTPTIVNTGNLQINPNTTENSEVPLIIADENAPPQPGPTMPIAHVIKSLLKFLAQESYQPLWNYEDITAKGNYYVVVFCM